MIKEQLTQVVADAVAACREQGVLPLPPEDTLPPIEIDVPRNAGFGDYATNVALVLAKVVRKPPRQVAESIVGKLRFAYGSPLQSAEVAGAGFINFRLAPGFLGDALRQIVREGDAFGRSDVGKGQRVLVEFVSANPNGPVTVAHGRGGAIGDALAALLDWTGHRVAREFYINDATNSTQMKTFARSVFARYRQLLGGDDTVPEDGYPGEYVIDIARDILERDGEKYKDLSLDEAVPLFLDLATQGMQEQQEAALRGFGIVYDNWYSEKALHEKGAVEAVLEELKARGHAEEENGALWLRSTRLDLGDDKDRVLVRADGSATYIAGDLAYHKDKFSRGFDRLINIWGADHHGYVARTKAGLAALGFDPARLFILIYQLVRLLKNGQEVRMGKRAGNYVTLEELLDEAGQDAARFFFLMRSPDSPLDFDLDLAKKQEKENPVYYAQYAHARCCSVFEKAGAAGIALPDAETADLALLTHEGEIALIKKLADFPEEVQEAAADCAPQRIPRYVLDLAALFHGYYDLGNRDSALRFVQPDNPALTAARLSLAMGVRAVLANAFRLLGISAPERMTREDTDV